MTKMTKNADTDKYKYQGHGIGFDLPGIKINYQIHYQIHYHSHYQSYQMNLDLNHHCGPWIVFVHCLKFF